VDFSGTKSMQRLHNTEEGEHLRSEKHQYLLE
jgi:hypothetical protein